MRTLLLGLIFCSLSFGAIAFVQTKTNSGETNSATVTLTGSPSSGDLLVAVVSSAGTVTTPSGWTLGNRVVEDIYIFYKTAGGSESKTFTAAVSTANGWCVAEYEFSGITAAIDQAQYNTGVSVSPNSTSTNTTSYANEVIIGDVTWWKSSGSFETISSLTSGYTWSSTITSGTSNNYDVALVAGYQIVSSTGSFAAAGTLSHNAVWEADVITFSGVTGAAAVQMMTHPF